ncbi:MAG TPA: hypothetical protein PKX87_02595 [Alphaproteobacteria bacterium]|nr:hypothetical protein [Alphaproteobacteria bacterium]
MDHDVTENPAIQIRRLKRSLQAWLGRAANERNLASNLVLLPDGGSGGIPRYAQCLAEVLAQQSSYKGDSADRPTSFAFLDAMEAIRRTRNTRDLYDLMRDRLQESPETDVLVVTGLEKTFDRSMWDGRENSQDRDCAYRADTLKTFAGLQYGRDEGNFKIPVFSVLCLPEWLYVPVRVGFADFVSWSLAYDLSRWEPPTPGGRPTPAVPLSPTP